MRRRCCGTPNWWHSSRSIRRTRHGLFAPKPGGLAKPQGSNSSGVEGATCKLLLDLGSGNTLTLPALPAAMQSDGLSRTFPLWPHSQVDYLLIRQARGCLAQMHRWGGLAGSRGWWFGGCGGRRLGLVFGGVGG